MSPQSESTRTINIERFKHLATTGALWVAVTSASAMPLAYYRNWVLSQFVNSETVVGTYALILIFSGIVTTLVVFGGTSVLSNYLPKIPESEDKFAFIMTYLAISIVSAILFAVFMVMSPHILAHLLGSTIDETLLPLLLALTFATTISSIVTYSLTGLMEFRISSLLSQTQLLLVCLVVTIMFFWSPSYIERNPSITLGIIVVTANILVIIFGVYPIYRKLRCYVFRFYLPEGFWRFSSFIHLNSITSFAYRNIDQIFVLSFLGVSELGVYFIMLQFAQLIRFVPDRIGQVMLSSFSSLIQNGYPGDLIRAYIRLSRIIVLFTTFLALTTIFFSYFISGFFGERFADSYLYLVALAVAVHISSLGSVNSMLIIAKERTTLFFLNNISQVAIQLIISLILLNTMGVYAVIVGKTCGIVAAQIGNFSILRWNLGSIELYPPKEYLLSLIIVIVSGVIVAFMDPGQIYLSSLGLITALGTFTIIVGFRVNEIRQVFRYVRGRAVEIQDNAQRL